MPPLIRLALAFGALFSARTVHAGNIRVDVVVDFNQGAKNIVRPSADKPAYYFPLAVGYKVVGDFPGLQIPPPPADQVEHLLALALFKEGYRLMTRQSPPSLVLVFRWGVMSPRVNVRSEMLAPNQPPPLQIANLAGPGMGAQQTLNMGAMNLNILAIPQYTQSETMQMLSLVGGDTFKDRGINIGNNLNAPTAEILDMARAPRYFMMVTAFAFKDWAPLFDDYRNHKPMPKKWHPLPLWEAHISTELAGQELAEVLPTLISTAAPMLGRETRTPQLIMASAVPMGRVVVGTPVMKNSLAPPANAAAP